MKWFNTGVCKTPIHRFESGRRLQITSSDVRVAQQIGLLASLPPVILAILIALDQIPATFALAVGLGVVFVALDILGWRITSAMIDRERLIAGTR